MTVVGLQVIKHLNVSFFLNHHHLYKLARCDQSRGSWASLSPFSGF